MKLTLDKMNRLVIPKSVRDRFALGPGTELELLIGADGIRLRPVVNQDAVAEEEGILVCISETPVATWDLDAFIEGQREGRSRVIGGV